MSDETEVVFPHADGQGRTIVTGKCRIERGGDGEQIRLWFGNRRSGRTTRMLEEAILRASSRPDRHAVVVAANANERERLAKELFRRKVVPRVVDVVSVQDNFDWERMIHNSFPASCSEFFVDHFAIEMHLAKAMEMLHRWDKP